MKKIGSAALINDDSDDDDDDDDDDNSSGGDGDSGGDGVMAAEPPETEVEPNATAAAPKRRLRIDDSDDEEDDAAGGDADERREERRRRRALYVTGDANIKRLTFRERLLRAGLPLPVATTFLAQARLNAPIDTSPRTLKAKAKELQTAAAAAGTRAGGGGGNRTAAAAYRMPVHRPQLVHTKHDDPVRVERATRDPPRAGSYPFSGMARDDISPNRSTAKPFVHASARYKITANPPVSSDEYSEPNHAIAERRPAVVNSKEIVARVPAKSKSSAAAASTGYQSKYLERQRAMKSIGASHSERVEWVDDERDRQLRELRLERERIVLHYKRQFEALSAHESSGELFAQQKTIRVDRLIRDLTSKRMEPKIAAASDERVRTKFIAAADTSGAATPVPIAKRSNAELEVIRSQMPVDSAGRHFLGLKLNPKSESELMFVQFPLQIPAGPPPDSKKAGADADADVAERSIADITNRFVPSYSRYSANRPSAAVRQQQQKQRAAELRSKPKSDTGKESKRRAIQFPPLPADDTNFREMVINFDESIAAAAEAAMKRTAPGITSASGELAQTDVSISAAGQPTGATGSTAGTTSATASLPASVAPAARPVLSAAEETAARVWPTTAATALQELDEAYEIALANERKVFDPRAHTSISQPHVRGRIGQLIVYRSGRTRLVLNEFAPKPHLRQTYRPGALDGWHWHVAMGVPTDSVHTKVAAVRAADSHGTFTELGVVSAPRIVCSVPPELMEPNYFGKD